MNLFEIQERLKDFSKDQLVKEMQMPSGTAPPFLVLSELQRRTRMEQAMQADGQGQPQSTVAEDAVNAAGVPQGGLQDMARALAPKTDMTENTGAAPVQPMQEGGQVKSGSAQLQSVVEQVMGGAATPVVPQIMSYADRIAQLPVMTPPTATTPVMPVTPTAPMPDLSGMSISELAGLQQSAPDLATRQAALEAMKSMQGDSGGFGRTYGFGAFSGQLVTDTTNPEYYHPENQAALAKRRTRRGGDAGGLAAGGLVKYRKGGLAGISPVLDTRSGLERMEDEQETALLMDESPTVRALRLSDIGADIGDFINEVGLNAIRQADALLAGGASLGARTAAGGTGALSALASVLGFPDTGAMLERTANDIAQKRSRLMAQTDTQRMPLGIPAPRLFTSPEVQPFTVPQEARNMYTEAEVMRKLRGFPDDSFIFSEGSVTEPLRGEYGLLPGSTGPSPLRTNEILGYDPELTPDYYQQPPQPYETYVPYSRLAGREDMPLMPITPERTPYFDVSTGTPLSMGEVEAAAFPSQADLDMRYREAQLEDRFPGEIALATERQAAAEARVPLKAFGGAGGTDRYRLPEPQGITDKILSGVGGALISPLISGAEMVGERFPSWVESGRELAAGAAQEFPSWVESGRELAAGAAQEFPSWVESVRELVAGAAQDTTTGTSLPVPEGDGQELLPPPAATDTAIAPSGASTGRSGAVSAGGAGRVGATGTPANAPMSDNERMLNQDKWFALAKVGLALMASPAPTLGQALGQAGMVGMEALSKAREAYLERKQAEELMALKRAAMASRGRGGGGGGIDLREPGISAAEGRLLESLDAELFKLTTERAGLDEGGWFRGEDPMIEVYNDRIKQLEDRRKALLDYYAGGFAPQGSTGVYSTTDVRE
jgi:hypothetical protein